ncbi:hypothetical protein [Streptomyces sp. bgisy027]|uniref:hypothetical protein n=1 Tax=Streptomyces sp. bgisy027 TaxID=3413770 RepID=UPI003D74292C
MTTTPRTRGATVWPTGLPSAGKTTIARLLPYEPPSDPSLVLPTQHQSPQESADAVYSVPAERGLV